MFCKICGKEINDQAVICPYCGCQVNGSVAVAKDDNRKVNVLCIVGFVLSLASLLIGLFGLVAIAGLVLSIVGVNQASKNNQKLKGLGIAGICVSAGSLLYTLIVLIVGISFLAML